MDEWRATLPFEFREVAPFHATRAGPGWVVLTAFEGPDVSANELRIVIRRTPIVARPSETAQTNLTFVLSAFSRVAKIEEQRTEPFASGSGDFIMASSEGRTFFQFLRVLPDRTYVRLSAVGESHAIEAVRDAVMESQAR